MILEYSVTSENHSSAKAQVHQLPPPLRILPDRFCFLEITQSYRHYHVVTTNRKTANTKPNY